MAHLHFRRTTYKRGGGKARTRIAYITRHPVHALDREEQRLRYLAEDREDLVYTNSHNLPDWARGNPHTYFKAAETYEGANRVAFEEWKIALPRELSHCANMALMHDLVDAIAGDTLPITYALHDPTALDGDQQPHLHLLLSARKTDAHARAPVQHFQRYNRTHPDRGGAEKDPAFWHRGAVKAWRVLVSDIINMHLDAHGLDARVHPDTLESRGIARAPEPKLLPSESAAYRENGTVSATMQEVLESRARSPHEKRDELRGVWAYWLQRKTALGITAGMPLSDQLACALAARQGRVQCPPGRLPSREVVQAMPQYNTASVQRLERQQRDAQRQRQRTPQTPRASLQHTLRQLAQRLQEQETHVGSALNVRIFRSETEREQGMGL